MSRSWWGKFFLLGFFVVLSGIYVFPTLANLNLETTKFPFKQKVNLGLDLQGGLYLVLGVDFNKVFRDVADRQAQSLQERLKDKSLPFTSVKLVTDQLPVDDPHVVLDYDAAKKNDVYGLVKKEFS